MQSSLFLVYADHIAGWHRASGMGVTHRWYDADKTILLHTYAGDWTMDDFYQIVDDTYTLITSVTHSVDVVIDMSQQGRAPNLMSGLSYAQRKNAPTSARRISSSRD
jgi:beta-galactosidase GanA